MAISERFFAGGRNSHRAYDRDALGVVGETILLAIDEDAAGNPVLDLMPTGGHGLLLVNLDYRFPIFGALQGEVFADAGNVWRDWADVDPREIKLGVGLGLRYRLPIGPLRIDVDCALAG